jgi:hypothetical protein
VAISTGSPGEIFGAGTPQPAGTPGLLRSSLEQSGAAGVGSPVGTPTVAPSPTPQPARFLGLDTTNWPANWRAILITIGVLVLLLVVIGLLTRPSRTPYL